MSEEKRFTLNEAHQEFAKKTNGNVWTLLEKEKRSQLEDEELIYAAYASGYHWSKVGGGVHHQRAEYLISKVYISLGQPVPALRHAQRCLALTKQHRAETRDFDVAFAYEGLARAYAINGQAEETIRYHKMAREAGDQIKNGQDKKIFDDDLAGGPWFGFV